MGNLKVGEAAKSSPVKSPGGTKAGGNSISPSVAGTTLGMPRVKVVDHRDRVVEIQDQNVELKDKWFNKDKQVSSTPPSWQWKI